ncbi:hypothetical protein CCACVL1_06104 [Corchorus capsularis]|uniref:Uncharacterized protein n=1 Tax=Corchorus capsularis TaxID=210143 RepID=A0A1R3JHD4_COCAP|nr:hypothetical protein CCACVL1_06104 [Corchorus capsularis]
MENSRAASGAEMKNGGATGNSRVDLTLKLGLPADDSNQQNQQVCPGQFPAVLMALDHLANPSFVGTPNTQPQTQAVCAQVPLATMAPNHPTSIVGPSTQPQVQQGMNEPAAGMVDQGAIGAAQLGQQSFMNGGSQNAWPPSGPMAINAFNQFSGPYMGFPSYATNPFPFNNFAPPTAYYPPPPPPPGPANTCVLIDVPASRRTDGDVGSSSGSGRRGGRRQRGVNYNDPNKRCTNYNCGTNNTPMWRKDVVQRLRHQAQERRGEKKKRITYGSSQRLALVDLNA